jgi:hypothetical protein
MTAAGGSTAGTSRASVLQLARAYEESLAGLSMALQMTQQKATETAALRDLLGRALQQRDEQQAGKGSNGDNSDSGSNAAQRIEQQQHISITAIAAGTAAVVRAADGDVAQTAGTGTDTTARPACGRGTGQRIRLFIGVYVSNSSRCYTVALNA